MYKIEINGVSAECAGRILVEVGKVVNEKHLYSGVLGESVCVLLEQRLEPSLHEDGKSLRFVYFPDGTFEIQASENVYKSDVYSRLLVFPELKERAPGIFCCDHYAKVI